ncbi:MAG: hypothetical protein GKR97_14840 [Rhizobiaceae bacterium]|nr:hypothetical protein [Rhizobiaceae bacterium]
MGTTEIFLLQFVLTLIVIGLLSRWYLAPWLVEKPLQVALGILIIPHAFRHIGMTFLTPAVVADTMPSGFAVAAGYGDLASGILAIFALIALRRNMAVAIGLVWTFNIVGSIDLINALRQAEAVPHFAAAWYIPTFLVPLLIVTHVMIFARLFRHSRWPQSNFRANPAA